MAIGSEAGTTDRLRVPLGTFEYEKGSRKTSCTTIGTTGARCVAVTATLWEDWLLAFLSLAWLLLFTSQVPLVETCSCLYFLLGWHSFHYSALPVQVILKAFMVAYRVLHG